jgi:hypothetical protein
VALAVGSRVPAGDFAFRVHSVFRAAMNLSPAGRRGLVTLVGAGADDDPHGIRLATREHFELWPVGVGTTGRRSCGMLEFHRAGGEAYWVIDLSAAVPTPAHAPPRIDPRTEPAHARWAACAARLEALQERRTADLRLAVLRGSGSPVTAMGERLADTAFALGGCVRAENAESAGQVAGRMLGLGTGLTPTGDDFLCGTLAALWCASAPGGRPREFLTAWGARLSALLDRTNAVSATFLEGAIAGSFPGALHAFASAFAGARGRGAHEEIHRAQDHLCALGHSSGMDTATGFLFGLRLRMD